MAEQTLQLNNSKVVPTAKGHFLLGNLRDVQRDILGTFTRVFAEYGDIVRLRMGPVSFYAFAHPDLANEMLAQKKDIFLKPYPNNDKPFGLALILGNGLLTNRDNDSWLSQRRMMQPIFHRKSIATMGDKMILAGEDMLKRWKNDHQAGDTLNLSHEMMKATLDIINRTMFSADVIADSDTIGNAVETAVKFVSTRTRNPFALPMSLPLPKHRAFFKAKSDVDTIIYGLINQRRQSGETHDDLLDMLLNARDEDTGEGMSDVQLRDEVITIFGAGHETTANGLTWTWYELSKNPQVLEKLQAEVDSVLGGRTPTLDDLPNLPYTLAVFEESMRLHPPAPLTIRRARQETTLGGYSIPAGSQMVVSFYHIHRLPEFWEDPLTFKPERFLAENKATINRNAYMPFGGGQRMCIGNNFALMEAQLLLALMAQNVEFRLAPTANVVEEPAITLRPKYGMPMTIHPRA